MLLLTLLVINCSEDATDPIPDTNPIEVIEIDPKSANFTALGEIRQFTAKAIDGNGGIVSTSFTWSSSNDQVVTISPSGRAESTGSGSAMIVVSASGKADTSQVTVHLPGNPTVSWISATSGNWSDPTNWSTGTVPQPEDTVAIPLNGTYTVTLTEDVAVKSLLLGAPEGTQTLATKSQQLTVESGQLSGGAELLVDGTAIINGDFDWLQGEITGNGTTEVTSGATFHVGGGQEAVLRANLINRGTFEFVSGTQLNIIGGTFENEAGAVIDFQSDASLYAINGGDFTNSGDLLKTGGNGISYIYVSPPERIINSGYIAVEQGTLSLDDCDLDGVIDVSTGAQLELTGINLIHPSLLDKSEGEIEIRGGILLGEQAEEMIELNNVVLNSTTLNNSISGPGDLTITESLSWRSGDISGPGKIIFGGLAEVVVEGSITKKISEREVYIEGSFETESLLNLSLSNGAQITFGPFSEWNHSGAGTIRRGSEVGLEKITINKMLRKMGDGNLSIGVDFICAGEMHIEEGTLFVQGDFELQSTGTLVAGGTDIWNEYLYRRLWVSNTSSAILAGTIEVDANGELAYLSILGPVTIEPTFRVLIDIDNNDPIPAERLTFPTSGVALDGTLDVNVMGVFPPPAGAQYRVVSTIDGPGRFDSINGAGVFTTIQQDSLGVLLIR